jgi:hypothetical protein
MRNYFIFCCIMFIAIACDKKDDLNNLENKIVSQIIAKNPNSICELVVIKQINGSNLFNRLNFKRDTSNKVLSMDYFDSTTNTIDFKTDFYYIGDTIKINANSWMLKNPQTNNIVKYFVKEKISDTTWDDILYEYNYDLSGKLTKKLIYYNQITSPDYITNYSYDGNNLVKSELLAGNGVTKIMQTDYQYDLSIRIKPWIYLYSDAFENYKLIQGFSFGKKAMNPVKQITTKVYDANNGNLMDTWLTSYKGYILSSDQYVLQVTTEGDNQQGIGLFLGTTRFEYSCK